MLKAGFIGAGGRSQGAHYPSVNRLEADVEMLGACELMRRHSHKFPRNMSSQTSSQTIGRCCIHWT